MNERMFRFPWMLSTLVLAAATGCAVTPPPADTFANSGLVWPPAPARPRIAFVTEFSHPEDLGIRPSVWGRLTAMAAGSNSNRLGRPMAVATSSNGELIYVADPGTHCVHRFDLRAGRYRCLLTANEVPLASPVSVTVSKEGRLFVADSAGDQVYVAGLGEDVLQPMDLVPPPLQPTGVAASPSGGLFVASTRSHSVRHYGPDGKLVREFGERGHGRGQLNYPTYLWFQPPRDLLVTDTMNFRIQRFDIDNGIISEFGEVGDGTGTMARPKGVAVDSEKHVYVMDGLHNALQIFDAQGTLLLAVGEQGQAPGQFWLPSGIHITEDDLIFIADAYNGRVQVFRYLGETSE